jgi:hypothetical protein
LRIESLFRQKTVTKELINKRQAIINEYLNARYAELVKRKKAVINNKNRIFENTIFFIALSESSIDACIARPQTTPGKYFDICDK